MSSIFTKIIKGEIPSHQIAESDDYLAFLDIRPLAPGHTLVIPKKEVDYLFDLTDDELAGLMIFAKGVARAIEAVVTCERIGVTVIGLEVPHAHVHLVPIKTVTDMTFGRPHHQMSNEEMADLARRIATEYERQNTTL